MKIVKIMLILLLVLSLNAQAIEFMNGNGDARDPESLAYKIITNNVKKFFFCLQQQAFFAIRFAQQQLFG